MRTPSLTMVGECTVLLASLAIGVNANAAPIDLALQVSPVIASNFITVDYNAVTDILTVSGFAFELDDGIGFNPIAGGTFDLSAAINDAGSLGGGSLTIGGTIAALGFNSGTLLTGSLTAFGFPGAGGDPLEFLFSNIGGDAAGLYGPTGGVILTNSGLPGSLFTHDFSSGPFQSLADTGVPRSGVPEPATLFLLGAGLVGLARYGRQSKSTSS